MNSIYLDTTSNKEVIVRLTMDKKVYEVKQEISFNRAQVALPIIQQLLNEHHLSPMELDKVEVNAGPGSFTGVRVGVAIANALSFGLGIPANGMQFLENGKLVEPLYE